MHCKWIGREIANGIQALKALGLEGQPPEDSTRLTADIWLRAFKAHLGLAIEKVDAPRIREAFQRSFSVLRRWPSPAMIIDLMPDRPKRDVLDAPELSEEQKEKNRVRIKEILQRISNEV